jgi:hypothetical protein
MEQQFDWKGAMDFVEGWYDDCVHTYASEAQQIKKAWLMGLHPHVVDSPYRWPVIDLQGRSVVDIGGGPVSMLLKCVNGQRTVLDPMTYPEWVGMRYKAAGIEVILGKAEELGADRTWDEAWIYNSLSHVESPELVIAKMQEVASTLRVCEWLGVDKPYPRHALTVEQLERWLGRPGAVTDTLDDECLAWYGVFPGRA